MSMSGDKPYPHHPSLTASGPLNAHQPQTSEGYREFQLPPLHYAATSSGSPNPREYIEEGQESRLLPGDEPRYNATRGPSTKVYEGYNSASSSGSLRGGTWWTRNFERPDWLFLIFHILLCGISFPLIYVALPHAHGTLFWVRLYVGLACSAIGVAVGFSLLKLARRWFEATAWATVIHQSTTTQNNGIRLGDMIAYTADGGSLWTTLRLMFVRWSYPGTNRHNRSSYDKRPWTLVLLFFLLCLTCTAALTFALGRVANISVRTLTDINEYREVAIAGDISEEDMEHAYGVSESPEVLGSFADFINYNDYPRAVMAEYNNSTIYFAEATTSQLWEGGHGLGTFASSTAGSDTMPLHVTSTSDLRQEVSQPNATTDLVLRYPKWGLRIHCETLPDLRNNLVMINDPDTYKRDVALIPRDLITNIYDRLGKPFPEAMDNKESLSDQLETIKKWGNVTKDFDGNASKWVRTMWSPSPNATITVSSFTNDTDDTTTGWDAMHLFIVRLNRNAAWDGYKFGNNWTLPSTDDYGEKINIDVGVDAVLCVEVYESWVVEVRNSTSGGPRTLRILGPGNGTNLDVGGVNEKRIGGDAQANRTLSSSFRYVEAFDAAKSNLDDRTQAKSENGFQLTPALSYYSNNTRTEPYRGLNPTYYAHARALSDVTYVLPYLIGSGKIVARAYGNYEEASVYVNLAAVLATLGTVLVLGIVAGLCTPRLPRDVPRREFGLYSWLAAIHGDRFLQEIGDGRLRPGMDIVTVEKAVANSNVVYRA